MKKRPNRHSRKATRTGLAGHALQGLLGQALQAFQDQHLEAARQLLEKLLAMDPCHVDALHLLGVIAGSLHDPTYAAELFRRALAENPRDATLHNNLAGALLETGHFREAVQCCDRALEMRPQYAEAFNNRGTGLKALGLLDAAVESYDRAVGLRPDFVAAFKNRGDALADLKRPDDALSSYDRAIELDPGHAEALYNRGITLMETGNPRAALQSFERTLQLEPAHAEAYGSQGSALLELKQFTAAVESFDRALAIDPGNADMHCNRGVALLELGQNEAALGSFDRAVALDPQSAEIHRNRGVTLQALKRDEEALASLRRAIELDPGFAEAYNNLGVALKDREQIDAALACFDRAIELRPEYAEAHWNKSLALLASGDLERGWKLYEWRWESERVRRAIATQPLRLAPDWDGEAQADSLLVLPEQGIGDEIFYSSMLRDLQGHARDITVCLDARLLPLFQRSFEGIDFRREVDLRQGEHFDFQVRLPSLGRFFRSDPAGMARVRVPYLFADRARADALRARLGRDDRLVCGLSWISKSARAEAEKSLSLGKLRPVLEQSDFRFVDLQYGETHTEQAALLAESGIGLERIAEVDNFADIDGLAALIDACDVVLTVSNTTAHLSAALGKPVLIMLPHGAGLLWYWHLGRSDSPWYPTARLFRQSPAGQWDGAFRAVIDWLRNHAGECKRQFGMTLEHQSPTIRRPN